MSADRNLLFGVLALHNGLVTRDQLIDAMNAWRLARHTPLGEVLREQGALSEDIRGALEQIVHQHIRQHQGDPGASLASLRADPRLCADLAQVGQADTADTTGPIPQGEGQRTVHVAAVTSGTCRYERLREHAR